MEFLKKYAANKIAEANELKDELPVSRHHEVYNTIKRVNEAVERYEKGLIDEDTAVIEIWMA